MRGWTSLFTKETNLQQYGTGVLLASAEADVLARVLPEVEAQFPRTTFTYVVPVRHKGLFQFPGEVLCLDDWKAAPLAALRALRQRRFGICVILWSTRPTYQKSRLAGLWLNAQRTILYNETGEPVLLDRAHWTALVKRMGKTSYRHRLLFFPLGFFYLIARTLWLHVRAKRQ